MRFQAILSKDAMYGTPSHPGRLRQVAHAPVRFAGRIRCARRFDDPEPSVVGVDPRATRAWLIYEPVKATLRKALAPLTYHAASQIHLLSDGCAGLAFRC